jgi:hypothetical protein
MSAWRELVVEGSEKTLRGFLVGFSAAEGKTAKASFAKFLGELLGTGSHHVVFAPEGVAERIVKRLAMVGHEADLHLAGYREIVEARLAFTVELFSKELATRTRDQLHDSLPEGVTAHDFHDQEDLDPQARGAELYAPEHHYIYRASGTLAGPFPGIVEMQRRARVLEFVEAEPIELTARDLPLPSAGTVPGE